MLPSDASPLLLTSLGQWFFFVLAIYKLARLAAVWLVARLPEAKRQRATNLGLAAFSLLIHFASGSVAPWPLLPGVCLSCWLFDLA